MEIRRSHSIGLTCLGTDTLRLLDQGGQLSYPTYVATPGRVLPTQTSYTQKTLKFQPPKRPGVTREGETQYQPQCLLGARPTSPIFRWCQHSRKSPCDAVFKNAASPLIHTSTPTSKMTTAPPENPNNDAEWAVREATRDSAQGS